MCNTGFAQPATHQRDRAVGFHVLSSEAEFPVPAFAFVVLTRERTGLGILEYAGIPYMIVVDDSIDIVSPLTL